MATLAREGARRVGRQLERGQQLAQEKIASTAGYDDKAVEPRVPDACTLRPVALKHGGRVHTHAARATRELLDAARQLPSAVAHHLVVIAPVGVIGHLCRAGRLETAWIVVHGQAYHRLGAGQQQGGVAAQVAVVARPGHAAVFALGQPLAIAVSRLAAHRARLGIAAGVKAQEPRLLLHAQGNITWGAAQSCNLSP